MLCSIEKFVFKKSRAELLTVMSKVTHLLVCIVLTPCSCFASSVSFGSFENLILFRQRLVSLSFKKTTTVHINLLEQFFFLRSMFAFIPLFIDFVRYLTSGTTRFKYRFSRISHKAC